MELKNTLQNIGLNEKQAKVYLAALELGRAPASRIAKKAGIKRPTTYVVLKELKKLGLVSQLKYQGTAHFTAASPNQLIDTFKKRFRQLKAGLPQLRALHSQPYQSDRPLIEIYEDKAGFEAVYAELVKNLEKVQSVVIFSSLAHIQKEFAHLLEKWHKTLQRAQPSIKELLVPSRLASAYKAEVEKIGNPQHQIKFLPEAAPGPKTEFIVFNSTSLILNLSKDIWVLKIKNQFIADSYRAVFEAAWNCL